MSEVAKISHVEQIPATVSHTAAGIAMIERAAANPNVDIDKMERLLLMQEKIMERDAKVAYASAFAEMQPKLPIIQRNGRIAITKNDRIIQSTPFATWEDIAEAIQPILGAHGFVLSFRTGLASDGRITVTAILLHREGHQEETMMTLPHDSTGSKNAVQAVGSSTSYGKRYTACALLNIVSRLPTDSDDDGKASGNGGTINQEQITAIQHLIVQVDADVPKFCKYFKVERIEDIPASQFDRVIATLEKKKGQS